MKALLDFFANLFTPLKSMYMDIRGIFVTDKKLSEMEQEIIRNAIIEDRYKNFLYCILYVFVIFLIYQAFNLMGQIGNEEFAADPSMGKKFLTILFFLGMYGVFKYGYMIFRYREKK